MPTHDAHEEDRAFKSERCRNGSMPRVTKLVVDGFKSFSRKTAIPLYGGMTAVVGENGSGKSNIIEALEFVMGQRSSHMRAGNMHHLIHASSQTSKDAAMVTLHLDNRDGALQPAFEEFGYSPAAEVTISRKITPSSATYKCMGANCKRQVIDRILELAGIDPTGPHIIKQEEVTNIVRKSPTERRGLIDDLAGITEYEQKKQVAFQELSEVEEKLKEQEIILEERSQHLEKLKKEKETAEKYKKLESTRDALDKAIVKVREQYLQEQLNKAREKYEKTKQEYDELSGNLSTEDDSLEEKEQEIEELDKSIAAEQGSNLVKDIEQLKSAIARKRDEMKMKEREIHTLNQSIEELQQMQQRRDNAPKAVNAALQLQEDGIYGRLQDLMNVPDRFATAIETAAGKHMQSLVVSDRSVATRCIQHVKQQGAGRITVLPLDKLQSRRPSQKAQETLQQPGIIDYAVNLINYDTAYSSAFSFVLHDTLVAENLEAVKDVDGIAAVTLDGDFVSKGGVMTGGVQKRRRSGGYGAQEKVREKEAHIAELRQEMDSVQDEIEELQTELERKSHQQEQEEQSSHSLWEKRKALTKELDELRQQRADNYSQVSQLRTQLQQLESSISHFINELEQVQQQDDPADNTSDHTQYLDMSVEELQQKRNRTIKQLNATGPVNMRAIEEYATYQQAYADAQQKVETITQEKEEIEQLIADIEEKKTEVFFSTLQTVSDHFHTIFQRLFGGGEAALHLENSDDLQSGLVISAQPPHTQVATIDSLSGGEKTLTALAFVMALQELEPSPFYVMDEIDAQLDNENAQKVAYLLNAYAEQAQVLLISHNQETIRHAHRIYGVSLVDGASQIRAIDLTEH